MYVTYDDLQLPHIDQTLSDLGEDRLDFIGNCRQLALHAYGKTPVVRLTFLLYRQFVWKHRYPDPTALNDMETRDA